MRAGDLRHLVTIQKPGGGVNDWGEPIPGDWQDVAQLWGDLRHLSGMASIKADADTSIVRASLRLRWRDDLDAGMRVLYDGNAYDIEAVLPGPTSEHVDLTLKLVT